MGKKDTSRLETVAPGIQQYTAKDGSMSYRVSVMVSGRQLTRTIPGRILAEVARQQDRPLSDDEVVLECQRIRLRLKLELEGGVSKEQAWDRVIGSARRDVPFDDFTLNVYLPSRKGEITNTGHEYTTKKLARHFGSRPLRAIDYDQIRAFVNGLKRDNLSASRIRDYTGVLSGIFALAVRKGIVSNNPARREDKQEHKAIWPPEPKSPRAGKFLSADEVDVLVTASRMIIVDGNLIQFDPEIHTGNQARYDTRWLGDLITFAFETGVRLGAILKLTVEQVRVPTTEYPYQHAYLRANQVKMREDRVVPLSTAAMEVVDRRLECLRSLEEDMNGDTTIFRGRWGQLKPKIDTTWGSVINKVKMLVPENERGRFDDLHFHDLRASWVVDLLNRGANLGEVQLIGGWSTLSAMMRYVRARKTKVESVQKALENRRERQRKTGKFVQI